ncbi:unnamed protein product [Calypogeia fissa]
MRCDAIKREPRKCKLMKCSAAVETAWSGVEWSDKEAARKRGQWRNEGARKHARNKRREQNHETKTGKKEKEKRQKTKKMNGRTERRTLNEIRCWSASFMFVPPTVVYAVKRSGAAAIDL